MPRLEIRPFSDDFLAGAGALLAARHRAHRAAEPLLPERYEQPAAAAQEVEIAWRADGASGTAALRDSRLVGFLVGSPKADDLWGANMWVEQAGHAVEEPEELRDLYAVAAARWVDEGRPRHYAMVPATDEALVDAWFRVGFGQQHAYGIQEVIDVPWPVDARPAEPGDVEGLIDLTPALSEHQELSPVFAPHRAHGDRDEQRRDLLDDMAKEEIGELVVERDGRIVGAFEIVPVEMSSMHAGLARPEGAALLGWAATLPEVRGSGAGLALMQAALAWARGRGHGVMVTDWRVTNLLSSRFWPARGFRTSFLRLYRAIP